MKNLVFLFIFLSCPFFAAAQTSPPPPPPPSENSAKDVLDFAEQMPEYPGGINALRREILIDYVIPREYLINGGKGGTIVVRFVVNESGNVSLINIMKNIPDCDECSQEAVRVIKNLKKSFTPGMQAGKPIKVWFTLPIQLNIDPGGGLFKKSLTKKELKKKRKQERKLRKTIKNLE